MDEEQKVEKLEHDREELEEKAATPPAEPTSPATSPASTPPSTGKSKIVLWAGLGLLVLALVATAAYSLGSRKATPTITPEPSPIETPPATQTPAIPTSSPSTTRAWQRYVNAEDGYEVDYPPGWTVDEDPSTTFLSPDANEDDVRPIDEGIVVVILASADPGRPTPLEVLQHYYRTPPYQEVTVGGFPAILYFESRPGILGRRSIKVIIRRGDSDKTYDLLAMYDPAREEEASQIVDRMLESWIYR